MKRIDTTRGARTGIPYELGPTFGSEPLGHSVTQRGIQQLRLEKALAVGSHNVARILLLFPGADNTTNVVYHSRETIE